MRPTTTTRPCSPLRTASTSTAATTAPGSSWLYDVLDSDGTVVVSGLRSCAGYYANSVNGLPEGVFAAIKGFESGWMDLTGQWLYAESIFASSNDEMDNGFF